MSEPRRPDAGLAPERTQLAWGRSGLALIACGAVLLRRVDVLASAGRGTAAGAVLVGMGAFVLTMSFVFGRRRARTATVDPRSLALAAYSTTALAVVAAVLGVVS